MSTNIKRFFLLTGDPGTKYSGVGKTTLTKKLSSLVTEKGVKPVGFYTEEVRNHRTREGFDVVTLDGKRGPLARDCSLLNEPAKFKVGKYGVLINEFENVALPCLNSVDNSHLLVIDEIGKMEFFSVPFKNKIKEIFFGVSNSVVLATIPVRRGDPLIEDIRNHPNVKLWVITRENRNNIHEEILNEMKQALQLSACLI